MYVTSLCTHVRTEQPPPIDRPLIRIISMTIDIKRVQNDMFQDRKNIKNKGLCTMNLK